MEGEFDPFTEEILPPPSSIEFEVPDVEPGVRREYQVMEADLDVVEQQTPDAPRRRADQPTPRTDRAEDLLHQRSQTRLRDDVGVPGIMEWSDDGAWDDAFGLDVVESF